MEERLARKVPMGRVGDPVDDVGPVVSPSSAGPTPTT